MQNNFQSDAHTKKTNAPATGNKIKRDWRLERVDGLINWQQWQITENYKNKIILKLFSRRRKKCQTSHLSAQWGSGERQNGKITSY